MKITGKIYTPAMKAELTREITGQTAYVAELKTLLNGKDYAYRFGERISIFHLEREEYALKLLVRRRRAMDSKKQLQHV